MKLTVLICALGFAVACAAGAVDLKNEDSATYTIVIHDGPTATTSSIAGNTTRPGICSECTIDVEGVGTIEAAGDTVVVIRNGELSVAE